jgi:electron transfer flavoprotein alpha subunit
MAEVLVLIDSADGRLKKSALELLTAARTLGEPVAVVIGAAGTAAALRDQLAEYGAAKVYAAESDEVADYLVAPKAEILATVAKQASPAAILVASTPENKEIAARAAFKLDSGFIADAVEVIPDGSA